MDSKVPKGRILFLILCLSGSLIAVSSFVVSVPLMVDKNLFSQSRKPNSEADRPVAQKNTQRFSPNGIQLDGVVIHGKTKKALVRFRDRPLRAKPTRGRSQQLVVQEGESIGDYKLIRITIRTIWLERSGERYELSLFSKTPKALSGGPPDGVPPPASQGEQRELRS
jgi:hypothetical protein